MQLLGILDNDNSHVITSHALLNGDDGILVVDHADQLYREVVQKIPQAKYLTSDEVFNPNNLHLFDKEGHGILTSKDPIFKHLFIITFYDKGQQNNIKSLSASGIKGIYVSNTTPNGEYIILMNDGTQRLLYNINKIQE